MGTRRLESLDAFRGFTIAGMILVNNPGTWTHVYAPLRHAEWHGWTPTDLIFPFFLFIVGVAMAFSVVPRLEHGSPSALLPRILRRAAIILGLGLLMSAYPRFDLGAMRLPGVLQRIGVVYLAASLLAIYTSRRGQALAAAALLAGYWAIMTLIPGPGGVPGDLSPDGNLAAVVDRAIFGTRLWQDTWDPEGLLSTLPAIATTMTGLFAGYLLRSGRPPEAITNRLFLWGWAAVLVGLAWDAVFPINKNLWTSSYTLFTSGLAMQALAACYWAIDVRGHRAWARPAVVFGKNAIAVYVLSGLVAETLIVLRVGDTSLYGWLYQSLFAPWAGPVNGSLAFAIATVTFWYAMMWLLYRRGIFIKV